MRSASSHAFFLIVLLGIFACIFKKILRTFPRSVILNHVVSTATQLKLSWDCLLLHSICHAPASPYKFSRSSVAGHSTENAASGLGVRVFEGRSGGETEPPECPICLCGIEDGEEVRELRCQHVFHVACLDRWLGTGRMTCPLCRSHVKTTGPPLGQLQDDVIVFDFFSRRRDECMWWIR